MRTSTRTALDRVAAQRDVPLDGGRTALPPWSPPDRDEPAFPRRDPEPSHHGRLVLVAAVTAAVALGAATVVATHGSPAAPVAPAAQRPAAPSVLAGLAAAAAAQPAPGRGTYSYVHTVEWATASSSVEGGPVVDVHTVRTDREVWLDDDGVGRIRSVDADGDPSRSVDQTADLSGGGPRPTAVPAPPAPGADVGAALLAQYPDRTGAQWLQGMTDTWSHRAVDPATQSALITILDGRGDVTVDGEVLDRVGRTGIAVSAEETSFGTTVRRTLVLDPTTGALLGAQDAPLDPGAPTPNDLFLTGPAYTAYLASGRTDDTTTTVAVAPPVLGGDAPALECAGGTASGFSVSLAAGASGDLLPQEAADDHVQADPTLGVQHQWRTSAGATAGELTLSNGTVLLTVGRLTDGTWAVTGGSRCG